MREGALRKGRRRWRFRLPDHVGSRLRLGSGAPHGKRLRVVWAEDSDSDRYLIKAAIAGTAFESSVRFATDGEQALRQIAKHRPTGVVLDINMPNVDGLRALRRIRSEDGDLPVVMFSTADDGDQVRQCRRLGILAFEVKPTDYDAFCAAVSRVLTRFLREPIAKAEPLVVRSRT